MTVHSLHLREASRIAYESDWPAPASCWPNETQSLLLKACLCGQKAAEAAFREWNGRVDVLKLDHGSNRLMALLFRNLDKHGIRGPDHERLKGNWRYHWYQNKMLVKNFRELYGNLEKAGIPSAALKGMPLILFYYPDIALRPMEDFDLLVQRQDVARTITFLTGQGYMPKREDLVLETLEKTIEESNGCGFIKEGTADVDLHWHVLHDCFYPWSDEAFWKKAGLLDSEGLSVRTLSPEDHLIHACAHGMRYNLVPPLRWIVDTFMILQKCGDRMDFNYLKWAAEERELALPVRKTLEYLKQQGILPSDHPALSLVPRLQVSCFERVEYPYRIHPAPRLPSFIRDWFQYQRRKHGSAVAADFLEYYRLRKNLPDREAAKKTIRQLVSGKENRDNIKIWMLGMFPWSKPFLGLVDLCVYLKPRRPRGDSQPFWFTWLDSRYRQHPLPGLPSFIAIWFQYQRLQYKTPGGLPGDYLDYYRQRKNLPDREAARRTLRHHASRKESRDSIKSWLRGMFPWSKPFLGLVDCCAYLKP
jgi:hypothetical protein